jgi:hypothetical protein
MGYRAIFAYAWDLAETGASDAPGKRAGDLIMARQLILEDF